jgi:citrate synthase
MSDKKWKTAITQIKPNEVRLRGYRIDDLMGQVTFAQAIYLALTGVLPSSRVAKLLDAMLVSSIDHGPTPPSTLAARTATSTGAPMNAAIAAGILSINRYHGAAIYDCMCTIQEALKRTMEGKKSLDEAAQELVSEYRQQKKRIAGLGHRIHSDDPRTRRLFALAEDLGIAGKGVAMLRALRAAMAASGVDLPINVDGALAALLVDLDLPSELANAFFIMARVPGLVAHIYEERSRERPMRQIDPESYEYDGPGDRDIEA